MERRLPEKREELSELITQRRRDLQEFIREMEDIALNSTWSDERIKAIKILGEAGATMSLVKVAKIGRWGDERNLALGLIKEQINKAKGLY